MIDIDDPKAIADFVSAAEQYFVELPNPSALFDKPFFPAEHSGYHVVRLGYLLHHLGHEASHTVVDFGAGMCWLTTVLARRGCQVVAVDVSKTALALGSQAIARADLRAGTPPPKLLYFDGFRIELENSSVDRIVCFDSFHHVPNKRAVLREFRRILKRGGRLCFVEPGPGHAASAEAREEAERWKVLEDEVDAPALCRMAIDEGFVSTYVVPLPNPDDNALTDDEYQASWASARPRRVLWSGNDALVVVSTLPLGARDVASATAPRASLEILECPPSVLAGEPYRLVVQAANTGDAMWFTVEGDTASHAPYGQRGCVTVGVQLARSGEQVPLKRDYARGFFENDVSPGNSGHAVIDAVAPAEPGIYRLQVDCVAEELFWFAQRGSEPAFACLRVGDVTTPDSRQPGVLNAAISAANGPAPDRLHLKVTNTGDTLWLSSPLRAGGWVRIGIQSSSDGGRTWNRDWRREPLPRDVAPGETVTLDLALTPATAGLGYKIDLVDELVCWFEDRGSSPLLVD